METLVRASLDLYECDDRPGWTFEKDGSGVKISRAQEFLHIHSFDSNGLRDTGRDSAKGQGSFRVLLLGDSFAAGLQVSNDDLFSTRLETSINEEPGEDPRLKIVNAAIDGYGTTEEILLFRRLAEQQEWDAVILQISTGNDVADNWPGAGSWTHWIAVKCGRPFFRSGQDGLVLMNGGRPVRRPMAPVHDLLSRLAIYSILVPFPPEPDEVHLDFGVDNMWQSIYRDKMELAWQHFTHVVFQFAKMVNERGYQ